MKENKKESKGNKIFMLVVAGLFLFLVVVLSMNSVDAITYISACGNLSTANETYVLTTDISAPATCLTVNATNVTIDCEGHLITFVQSFTGYGIISSGYNFTTVRNCDFYRESLLTIGSYTIYYSNSNNGLIENNTATSASLYGYGIRLSNSDSNTLLNNTLDLIGTIYGYGIYLDSSSKNILMNNNVTTTLTNSYMLEGTTSSDYNNSIDVSNIADGKPVNYTYNAENLIFDYVDFTPYGQVIFGWSRNITITNSNFSRDSLNLFYTNTSLIANNIINTSTGFGIWLYKTSNSNNISNNVITTSSSNFHSGIFLQFSDSNTISNNTIKTSSRYSSGIFLASASKNNTLVGNNINLTTLTYNAPGIYLWGCPNNKIEFNTIITFGNNDFGVNLRNSDNNVLNNNTVVTYALESDGIYFTSSTNNTLRGNLVNTSSGNSYSIWGTVSPDYNNSIDGSNLAEGLRVNFTCNADNLIVEGVDFTNYGQVIFCNGKNITITNSNFSSDSLSLFSINASTISNNRLNASTGYGIWLYSYSNNNVIDNNTIITYCNYCTAFYSSNSLGTSLNNNFTNNRITTFGNNGYGIVLTDNSDSTYLINNRITTFGSTSHGIDLLGYSNATNIKNNIINTSNGTSNGIRLGTSDNNLNNNTLLISADGFSVTGIFLYSNSNNKVYNSNITMMGTNNGMGFDLDSSTDNIFINNTIATLASASTGTGIRIRNNNNNNTFLGMNIFAKNAHAIYMETNSNSFVFSDSIVNASNSGKSEFYIANTADGGTWNFTNVTDVGRNPITINWTVGANGTLNMHWYMDAYVHSGANNLTGANVTSYDNQPAFEFSELTASNGRIARKTLLEYKRNETSGTSYTRYSPYNLSVTLEDYFSYYNSSINLSNNVFMDINLAEIVYSCRDLNVTGAAYMLNQSVNSPGTCFNVLANNVDLDCDRYLVNYSQSILGYGVNSSNYNSTEVRNCLITEGRDTGDSDHAIYYYKSGNGTIENNIITTSSNSSRGISLLTNSNNNNLINNTITALGMFEMGIYLYSSSNNNNINNIIKLSELNGYSYGIYLDLNSDNNTLTNNIINSSSNNNIYLSHSKNNSIANNIITSNSGGIMEGVSLHSSLNNIINNNTITIFGNQAQGISLESDSNNNILNNNTVTNLYLYGVYLTSSTNNTLSENKANTTRSNSYVLDGTNSTHYNNSIDISNLAEGLPVNYTYNAENLVFSGVNFTGYGQVIFGWCRNITIKNSNFSSDSLNLFGTNISTIANNRINTSTGYGVWLYGSSNNNTINNNTITTSGLSGAGIYLHVNSNNNNLNNNTITTSGNYGHGIQLRYSSNNNDVISNRINITSTGTGAHGVHLTNYANNNNVYDNIIITSSYGGHGIQAAYGASSNTLFNNTVTTFGYDAIGIDLFGGVVNNSVFINTIRTFYTGIGIRLYSSQNSSVNDNNITTNYGPGIQLYSNPINNNLNNNTITTSGTYAYGIQFYSGSDKNTFSGINIKTNGTTAYAVSLEGGSHSFSISDSILNSSKSGVQELYIKSNVTGGIWNFTNVTDAARNPITLNWTAGANGTLNMHWYLDAYAHAGANNITGANVTSYDNKSAFEFSELTGSNGRIARKTLLEYTRNETSGVSYMWYSPYNLSVVLIGYSSYYNSSISLSNNVFMDLDLGCGCPVGSDWIVSLNCTLIDSVCSMPSYKVICTSGSLTMSNYTIIADKVITPIGHGCLILDNRSRVVIGS
jgi:parallel beta-helix repeat protein